ncbi:MAG: SRPBCC domain-containing protein [Bacteroidia bacterium]
MKTKDIHQTVDFKCEPLKLYNCIMNSKKHSAFTGSAAVIKDKEGEEFKVFDGYAHGKNIALQKGKKIVQTWRANEEGWPEDHFSEVSFLFKKIALGTRMEFYHTGIPAKHAKAIEDGWNEFYWEPLKEFVK